MAKHNYHKYIISGNKIEPKKYLYVFRALMAGIYALDTGVIEPNILTLQDHFEIPDIETLVSAKIEGRIPKLDVNTLHITVDDLFNRIDKAYEESKLPDKFENIDELDEWLIDFRLNNISYRWI